MEGAEGSLVRVGKLELRFHIDESQGSGELVMFEMLIPPQARVPAPHHHEAVDEAVYGLGGVVTTTVDGAKREVRSGDALLILRGSIHQHENLHEEPARALVVLNPGSIGRGYFEEIASAVNGPTKPDPARLQEIMLRHGLVPAV